MNTTEPLSEPLTVVQLRAMQLDGGICAVISLPWHETGDIDNLNDSASEKVTGDAGALVDIGYRLVGADVEKQEVLIQVTGNIEDDWWDDQGYFDDKEGYCVVDDTLYHRLYPTEPLGEFQDDDDDGFVPSRFLLEQPPDCHRVTDLWVKKYLAEER